MRIIAMSVLGALLMLGCSKSAVQKDLDPDAAALISRVQAAYDRGDWNTALVLADSAERRSFAVPDLYFTRGLILTKMRRFDAAQRAFERVLALDPEYRKAWYNLGHNAFLQRQYREALRYYEQERALITKVGRRADSGGQDRLALSAIAAQIGRTYALLGKRDSAEVAYQEALALDGTYPVAHAWLSELYEEQGHIEQALEHARKAFEGNPNETEYAYRLGALLFQSGQVAASVPLLSSVVQRWPGHEGATYNLGRALIAAGHEKEGQALLDRIDEIQRLQEEAGIAQRAVEVFPDDPQRWITLAGLMLRSGYYDKAEEAFRAALARKPNDLSLRNDLANLAIVRGDTALALQRFQELVRDDSTFADGWLNLGIIYAMTGQSQAARAAWQQVLRYKPDDPDVKAYLARLD